MRKDLLRETSPESLFALPCVCQNLRRAMRIVTRIYDEELKNVGLEITQFGLLTALATAGEVNQRRLSEGFVMDSTTLTRTLDRMRKRGWIFVKPGKDRRERLFSLTAAGKELLKKAEPYWNRAESRLKRKLGEKDWRRMKTTVSNLTKVALEA